MLQTFWELNRQNIRKAVDALSGIAIGWLGSQGEWGVALVPTALIGVNFIWFWLDNRKKVTVEGLAAAGMSAAAEAVANAEAIQKKKSNQ